MIIRSGLIRKDLPKGRSSSRTRQISVVINSMARVIRSLMSEVEYLLTLLTGYGVIEFFPLTLGFIFTGYYRLANPVTDADSQLTSKKRLQRHYIQPAMVKIEIKTGCPINKE